MEDNLLEEKPTEVQINASELLKRLRTFPREGLIVMAESLAGNLAVHDFDPEESKETKEKHNQQTLYYLAVAFKEAEIELFRRKMEK